MFKLNPVHIKLSVLPQ